MKDAEVESERPLSTPAAREVEMKQLHTSTPPSSPQSATHPGTRERRGQHELGEDGEEEAEAEDADDDQELGQAETTKYRSIVARMNFLSHDRPDVQYPIKEACRRMSAPTKRDWKKMLRIARYLKGRPRAQSVF